MTQREINETGISQGADESIAYTLTTTPWGSSPSSVSVKCYDVTAGGTDVTATKLTGSASVASNVITLPVLASLTAGTLYRLEIKFTCSGNIFEAYAYVMGE